MKNLMILLALMLIVSCKKDDERSGVNANIYGDYTAQETCSTGNFSQGISVVPYNSTMVKWFFRSGPWVVGDTMLMNVNGGNLSIPSQSFAQSNGYIRTITGSGTSSGNQILLTTSEVYQKAGSQTIIKNCTVSGVK